MVAAPHAGPDHLDVRTLGEREIDAAYAAVQVAYAHARVTVFDRHPGGAIDDSCLTGVERAALDQFRAAEHRLDELRRQSHQRVAHLVDLTAPEARPDLRVAGGSRAQAR
jgi:hypothetical protein